ncbi:MAG: hypothetical protein GVY12_04025 [Bacteroidetes bacterium]|jgi:hypothetical protein|nr:hypothetical protein [Bacteroidota bacterium]
MAAGVSAPLAIGGSALLTVISAGAAAYRTSTTPNDLPTSIKQAFATMPDEKTDWQDVVDHFEPQLRAIGAEGLRALAEVAQDENAQKLVVAAANDDIDIPWVPEEMERIVFDQAYNAIQFGIGQLAQKGLELLEWDEE